jgi:hypothetical protein
VTAAAACLICLGSDGRCQLRPGGWFRAGSDLIQVRAASGLVQVSTELFQGWFRLVQSCFRLSACMDLSGNTTSVVCQGTVVFVVESGFAVESLMRPGIRDESGRFEEFLIRNP